MKKDGSIEGTQGSPDDQSSSSKLKPAKQFSDVFERRPKETPGGQIASQTSNSGGASVATGNSQAPPVKSSSEYDPWQVDSKTA